MVQMTNIHVLYIPKLTNNLFSILATWKGNVILLVHKNCWIQNKKRRLIGTGLPMGKLYKLVCKVLNSLTDKVTVAGEIEN